jgi:hypothetical protein
MRAKASTSRASNDVHGAALAIAVLNFMRPNFRTPVIPASGHLDLTRKDGYDQTVDKILGDYFPVAADQMEENAVFWEAHRLKGVLASSGALIRALARQRTAK